MLYYLFFYFTASFLFAINHINKKVICIYIVLILAFVFSALRYDAGYDYFSYLYLIRYGDGISFERLEIFNRIIILFSRQFDFPQFYYIATSFVYILFMTLGFRELKSLNLITVSSMLFFIGAYLTSFDIIRQMAAVAIVFYSISMFMNRRFLISALLLFLAVGFHKSAYLFLGVVVYMWFIKSKRFSYITYFIAVLGAFFATGFFVLLSNYTGLYIGYFDSGGNETGGSIYLMLVFYTLSLLFFSGFLKVRNDDFWTYFNLFFLGVLIYTALLPYGYFATRISYFLFPFGFLAWSEIVKSSYKNKNLITAYVYIFSSVIFFLMLFISSYSIREPFLNYKFYFYNYL